MVNRFVTMLLLMSSVGMAYAQRFEVADPEEKGNFNRVWTNGFWSNWYVQMDLDMTLQNP